MPQFKYEKGRLYVRLMDGEIQELFHPTEPEKRVMRSIAAFRYSHAVPYFSGYLECIRGASGTTGSGRKVEIRLASDSDIRTILKAWDPHKAPRKWLKDVKNEPIQRAEFDRVARIVKEVS